MKLIFSTHAKERMTLRGISEAMVKNAIEKPDKSGIGYDGRSLVFKEIKKGIIKVVFVQNKASCVIISVIWESIHKQ